MSAGLLLDEHISPDVAAAVRRVRPDIPIQSVLHWRDGALAGQDDARLLEAAAQEGWILVTYDQATIPPILREWGYAGKAHGGVVFVDTRSIHPADVGGLMRALLVLWERCREQEDTTGWIAFLQPESRG